MQIKEIKTPILILSSEKERTTDLVLSYLNYFKANFNRISNSNVLTNINFTLGDNQFEDELELEGNLKTLRITKPKSLWYRRSDLSFEFKYNNEEYNNKFNQYILKEWNFLKYFLYDYNNLLGSYIKETENNKLVNLTLARKSKLKIPYTLITTKKSNLLEFAKKSDKIITKPIHNAHINFHKNNSTFQCKGLVVCDDVMLGNLSETFAPSLFQEYIEKEYEVRVFFMKQKIYAMAIFSQLDERTKYDFRNYNDTKPNRNVPYEFDNETKQKILEFIRLSDLDTGSIDLIFSKKSEYIFLEVNPTGQFGWVSSNCNYYIEKEIAKHLIQTNE